MKSPTLILDSPLTSPTRTHHRHRRNHQRHLRHLSESGVLSSIEIFTADSQLDSPTIPSEDMKNPSSEVRSDLKRVGSVSSLDSGISTISSVSSDLQQQQSDVHKEEAIPNSAANIPPPSNLMSSLVQFLGSVDKMEETVMLPSRLQDMGGATSSSADLHSLYFTLKDVQSELVSGKLPDDSSPSLTTSDYLADEQPELCQPAAATREIEKLRCLVREMQGVLGQMTGWAEYLTDRYEESTGGK